MTTLGTWTGISADLSVNAYRSTDGRGYVAIVSGYDRTGHYRQIMGQGRTEAVAVRQALRAVARGWVFR